MPSWDVMRFGCKKCRDATLEVSAEAPGHQWWKIITYPETSRNTALYNLETSLPTPQFVRTTTSLVADWHLFKGSRFTPTQAARDARSTADVGTTICPAAVVCATAMVTCQKISLIERYSNYAWLKGSWMETNCKSGGVVLMLRISGVQVVQE